jgi:hypothetical protein
MECVDGHVTLAILSVEMHVVPLDPLTQPVPVSMECVDGHVTLAILSVEMHVVHLVVVNAPADQAACAKLEVSATPASSV